MDDQASGNSKMTEALSPSDTPTRNASSASAVTRDGPSTSAHASVSEGGSLVAFGSGLYSTPSHDYHDQDHIQTPLLFGDGGHQTYSEIAGNAQQTDVVHHDLTAVLFFQGPTSSFPELIPPPKKAAPEHIEHDHNLARNPVQVHVRQVAGMEDSESALVQHQVPLMPQHIFFAGQSDISTEFLSSHVDSSETEQRPQQFISNQAIQDASVPSSPSMDVSNLRNLQNSDNSLQLRRTIDAPARSGEESEDIIEITLDDDEVRVKEPLHAAPKKKPHHKWTIMPSLSLNPDAHKITIPINGGTGTVVVQRYMFSSKLCRICLLEKEYLLSIFEDMKFTPEGVVENARGPNSCNRYNMAAALKTLLDIDVKLDDGLSSLICIECIDSLMSFSAFKKRIGLGQTRLGEILVQVKDSVTPTLIPALGEEDIKKLEIYRYSDSIIRAKKLLSCSSHSHLVVRRIPDKIWEKLFTTLVLMMGFKSARLKELEHYIMDPPFVKAWFCKTCGLTIYGPQDTFVQHCLNSHAETVASSHDVKFPCDVCGGYYHRTSVPGIEEVYTDHWVQHFFFHQCDICDKKMPSLKGLWVHKKSLHVVSQALPTKECDVCSKRFKRRSQLLAHKKIHLEPEERVKLMSKCPICEKNLSGSVAAHVASVHSESRPWKCDICHKCFKRKETLVGHRSSVHSAAKFQCDICGIYLSSLSIKKTHEFRHKGIKPHKCDKCDQSFFDKTALKSHQATHKEIADICCHLCDKTFKRQMYLKEHMRIHSEEKPFECPICKRRIRIRANYYKHLKVHKKNGTFDIAKAGQTEAVNTGTIAIS